MLYLDFSMMIWHNNVIKFCWSDLPNQNLNSFCMIETWHLTKLLTEIVNIKNCFFSLKSLISSFKTEFHRRNYENEKLFLFRCVSFEVRISARVFITGWFKNEFSWISFIDENLISLCSSLWSQKVIRNLTDFERIIWKEEQYFILIVFS